jgi:hypothetical protein
MATFEGHLHRLTCIPNTTVADKVLRPYCLQAMKHNLYAESDKHLSSGHDQYLSFAHEQVDGLDQHQFLLELSEAIEERIGELKAEVVAAIQASLGGGQ